MLRQSAALRAIVRPAVVGKKGVNSGLALGQKRAAHAISNPTLANIEKRWEGLPPQEQADLWMALRDRMKVNWSELTLQEKKAAYYIAFGAHGPRAQAPPNEGWKVFGYVCAGIGATFVLFAGIRSFAKGGPSTMNKEYQEATNEYLKVCLYVPLFRYLFEMLVYSGRGGQMGYQKTGQMSHMTVYYRQLLTPLPTTGTKLGTHLRYLIRRILRPRNGPERSKEELDTSTQLNSSIHHTLTQSRPNIFTSCFRCTASSTL
ncbi:Cytochrome c oxidase subunit 5A [Cadophora gregata f. sp. sojae]|nr:Cytochrome c oxidase subunit 5A [Cadophora gregata f. sp. sojae]